MAFDQPCPPDSLRRSADFPVALFGARQKVELNNGALSRISIFTFRTFVDSFSTSEMLSTEKVILEILFLE